MYCAEAEGQEWMFLIYCLAAVRVPRWSLTALELADYSDSR